MHCTVNSIYILSHRGSIPVTVIFAYTGTNQHQKRQYTRFAKWMSAAWKKMTRQ